jgi:hypothetical protein
MNILFAIILGKFTIIRFFQKRSLDSTNFKLINEKVIMKTILFISIVATLGTQLYAQDVHEHTESVADSVINEQRAKLSLSTKDKGYGPQSPRNIDVIEGSNTLDFNSAPAYTEMNLCNIHFHENAEHKGGEFTQYAGNGDGHGYNSGYEYTGTLSETELTPVEQKICSSKHGDLQPGDTIEVHYVYSTAKVKPGPTLASCLSKAVKNPQLLVEAQVYVVTSDKDDLDFKTLTAHGMRNGFHQALNLPNSTGTPVRYDGSTTGPSYNEVGSPFQVSWSVHPKVLKVNINTVGDWCKGNIFNEDHGHGVRNLVINPSLLSDN